MGIVKQDDRWRLPDELWNKWHRCYYLGSHIPLGCHNPRDPDWAAMNAIFLCSGPAASGMPLTDEPDMIRCGNMKTDAQRH
ncbi:MAG: hypothetical protein ACJ8G3_10670 [Burkholderiaceae bacterium]